MEVISKGDILCMLYNLPSSGVITSRNPSLISKNLKEDLENILYSSKIYRIKNFIVERSPQRNLEKLFCAENKYFHLYPEQIKLIVDNMLSPFTNDEYLTFE